MSKARVRFDLGPSVYDLPPDRANSEVKRMTSQSASRSMLNSIQDLVEQKERLEAEIARQKIQERKEVIAQIVDVVNTYQVPIDELFAALGGYPRKSGFTVAAKYRDPKSGVTWSGRGKTPVWLRDKPKEEWERYAIPG